MHACFAISRFASLNCQVSLTVKKMDLSSQGVHTASAALYMIYIPYFVVTSLDRTLGRKRCSKCYEVKLL